MKVEQCRTETRLFSFRRLKEEKISVRSKHLRLLAPNHWMGSVSFLFLKQKLQCFGLVVPQHITSLTRLTPGPFSST